MMLPDLREASFIMTNIFNQIKYPYPTKLIEIKGHQIAFIDEGKSEKVLLFIHGLGSYLKAWSRNFPELTKHFRCIALDLPGYGKSSKAIHSGKVSFYVEVLKEFIDKLELKNLTLVGHSMGGQISLSFAIKCPNQLDKLVLAAPAGFESFTDEEIELFRKIVSPDIIFRTSNEQIKFNYKINFYNMPPEAEEMINDRILIKEDPEFYNHCSVVSNSLFGLLKEPIFNRLDKLNTSTLILFGLDDLLIPNKSLHETTTKEIATIGASKIKDSRLILFEKCGHFIQFEKPDEFNKSIIQFINS